MRPKLLCYPGFKGGASLLELASLLTSTRLRLLPFYDDADAGSRAIRARLSDGIIPDAPRVELKFMITRGCPGAMIDNDSGPIQDEGRVA